MRSQVWASALLAAALLSAGGVRADQLEALTEVQAKKAVEFLKKQKQVVIWCACCDSDGKRLITVSGVSYVKSGEYYGVVVEGADLKGGKQSLGVDLAYVHYLSDGWARNVGKALGFECDPCTDAFVYDVKAETAAAQAEAAAQAAAEAAAAAQAQASGGSIQDVMARGRKFFEGGDDDRAIAEYSAAQSAAGASAQERAASLYERGKAYFNKKEYDKAAADYTEAIKAGLSGASIYANRARAYAELEEHDKAIADFTEAIKLSTSGANKALYHYNRGLAYGRINDYVNAIADYTAYLAINPKDGGVYYSRGIAYFRSDDYAKAAADLEAAKKNTPGASPDMAQIDKALAAAKAALHHQKSMAFAVKGDIDNAIREIDEAIKFDPDEAGYLWNRCAMHVENGDYASAKADVSAVLRVKPNFPGAKEMLERISEEERAASEESASGRVQAGQQAGPRSGRGVGVGVGGQRGGGHRASALRYYNRGLNAYNARDYDMAIESFTDAIKVNPRDASYYDSRASAYLKKRDYDRAIADYTEAVRLSPRRADFYVNRGDAYFDKGVYNRAVTDYTEAIRLDPRNADYYCYRGESYMSALNYRNAAADFESALRLDPRHPDAQDLLRQAKSQGRGYRIQPRNNRGRRW